MKFGRTFAATASLMAMSTAASAFPIAVGGDGFAVIVTSTDEIIATYQGNSAAYSNNLYLENTGAFLFNNQSSLWGSTVNLGSFAIGTELIFRLEVTNTGYSYFTGDASRNPDGYAHARVQSDWQANEALVSFEDLYNGPFDFNDLSFSFTSTRGAPEAPGVPEPASWALMIGGLGLVGASMRHRRTAVRFA